MSRETNIGDAWGGLAAMLVALPQALCLRQADEELGHLHDA